MQLDERERLCLEVLVGVKLLQKVTARIDKESAARESTTNDPPAVTRQPWKDVKASLAKQGKDYCDNRGGGHGGPRVMAAVEWVLTQHRGELSRLIQMRGYWTPDKVPHTWGETIAYAARLGFPGQVPVSDSGPAGFVALGAGTAGVAEEVLVLLAAIVAEGVPVPVPAP